MKKLGCFHAHHSNIEHIEKALGNYNIKLIHFVDPGFDGRKGESNFTSELVHKKIKDMLNWIAGSGVDGILVTCTFFTAHFQEKELECPVPIMKIDTPLFLDICEREGLQTLAFTNPDTVEGTMNQLFEFARRGKKKIKVIPYLVDNAFNLIMTGEQENYRALVEEKLEDYVEEHIDKTLSVAQLSMASLAENVEGKTGVFIGSPLKSLGRYVEEVLNLKCDILS
jgi:aspartate/glutamate racemase